MRFPCFNKTYNSYAKEFLADFYNDLSLFQNVQNLLSLEDKKAIDSIILKNYGYTFWQVYKQKNRLKSFPQCAVEFNKTYTQLLVEAVLLVFCSDFQTYQKKLYFENLVNLIHMEIISEDKKTKTNTEFIFNVKSKLKTEIEFLLLKQTNKDETIENSNIRESCYTHILQKLFGYNGFSKIISNLEKKFYDLFPQNSFTICFITFLAFLLLWKMDLQNNYAYYIYLSFCICLTFMLILEIKSFKKELRCIKEFNNENGCYLNLGVDVISVHIAQELLDFTEPDKQNMILPAIGDLRLDFVEKYGVVLPFVRVMDSYNFEKGFKVFVRGLEVCHLNLHLDKYVIFACEIEKGNITLPENYITEEYDNEIFYFIDIENIEDEKENYYYTPIQFFKYVLNKIFYKHIDKIFTIEQAYTLTDFAEAYERDLKLLFERFSIYDIKELYVKIIQKGQSLKDIRYVVDRMIFHSNNSRDLEYIAFFVCEDLKKLNEISMQN